MKGKFIRSFHEVVAIAKAGRYEKAFADEIWLGIRDNLLAVMGRS